MSNSIQTEVTASEVVIGAPVCIIGTGKTLTEKRLSIVAQSSTPALLIAATMPGKVGKAARDGLASHAPEMLAKHILSGNYRSIGQALYMRLGEPVSFGSAAEALPGETASQFVERQREDFRLFGALTRRAMAGIPATTKSGKPSAKYTRYADALALYNDVLKCIAAEMERREAAKKEREAQAQPAQS